MVDAIERQTYDSISMFVKAGVLNIDMKDFETKLQKSMISIKRPLYGLLYVKKITRTVVKMVQVAPTGVSRQYQMCEPWPGSRVYAEQHKDGISVFMLSEVADAHANLFVNLTNI